MQCRRLNIILSTISRCTAQLPGDCHGRLHLRPRAVPARQRQARRRAPRGDRRRTRAAGARRPARPLHARHPAHRRRRARLRDAGRRARRGHRANRRADGGLRRVGARRADQPLLLFRPRGREHGSGQGDGGSGARRHRRRRREHVARAHGLGWRRLGGRPRGRLPELLRAAGHQRRPRRHAPRPFTARSRRVCGRQPAARRGRLGRRALRALGRADPRPARHRTPGAGRDGPRVDDARGLGRA